MFRIALPAAIAVAATAVAGCARHQNDARASSRHALVAEVTPADCNSNGDAIGLSIAWIDSTDVALIDSDSEQVVVCGVDTPSTRRLGRRGGGPGEFMGAYILLGEGDRRILVADIRTNTVTALSASGKYEGSARVPGLPSHLLAAKGDSVWLVWSDEGGQMAPTVGTLSLADGSSHVLFPLVPDGAGRGAPTVKSPLFAVASAGGRWFYYADVRKYSITQTSGTGDVVRTFGRYDQPIEYPTEAEVSARMTMMEGLAHARGMSMPSSMVKSFSEAMRHQAKPFLTMQSFAIGPNGELYVVTRRHLGDSTDVDVFDGDGSLATTYVLRDTVRAIAFSGSRLAALAARADGGDPGGAVDVYRIDSLVTARR